MAMKHKLIKSTVNIHTFMINLFQDNDGESSNYEDTRLVCRDGTIFSSRLLLSLAFPTLGRSLAMLRESIDPVIILPDYTAEEVKKDIHAFLSENNPESGTIGSLYYDFQRDETLDFKSGQNNIDWANEYQANIKDEVEIKREVPDEALIPEQLNNSDFIQTKEEESENCKVLSNGYQIKLPVEAEWVPGRMKGSHVLIDPAGYRMRLKNSSNKMKFFHCLGKEKYFCNITCTVKKSTNMIVSYRGYMHNHDNQIVKDTVRKIIDTNVEEAVNSDYTHPKNTLQNITDAVLSSTSAEQGAAYLPSEKALARRLLRKRKLLLEALPLPTEWLSAGEK